MSIYYRIINKCKGELKMIDVMKKIVKKPEISSKWKLEFLAIQEFFKL